MTCWVAMLEGDAQPAMKTGRLLVGGSLAVLVLLAGRPAGAAGPEGFRPLFELSPRRAELSSLARTRPAGNLRRALLEEGVLLTAATLYYWGEYDHFTIDWQFTWKTFGRKFFTAESPMMDSNSFWSNWTHGPQGALYYTMARANGLSQAASTVFAFGTSFLWEAVCEWRELISINDMIFTTFGGPAGGEPFYQISSYFGRRKGFWNGAASFLFDPVLAFNDWLDRGRGPAWNSGPGIGWHRFALYAGSRNERAWPEGTTAVDHSGPSRCQFNLGLEMETDAVPRSGRTTAGRRHLSGTLVSRLSADMSFGPSGMEEAQIRTSAVLCGVNWQSEETAPDGSLRGGDVSLGFGMAFDYFKKRPVAWYDGRDEVEGGGQATEGEGRLERPTPTRFTDKLSVISPAGAVLVVSRFGPRRLLRWTSGLYVDFALVNALAYNQFTEAGDTTGVKTTLLNWGYYYALGTTLASDVIWDWRQWRGQASASWRAYSSIQGLDRYQYKGLITNDFRLWDTWLTWRVKLGYRLKGTPVEWALAAEGINRHSGLLHLREHYGERRIFYQLRLLF